MCVEINSYCNITGKSWVSVNDVISRNSQLVMCSIILKRSEVRAPINATNKNITTSVSVYAV